MLLLLLPGGLAAANAAGAHAAATDGRAAVAERARRTAAGISL